MSRVKFGILGPLEVTAAGRPLAVPGPRSRAVLAMLLVRANQVVPAGRMIEELWPGLPPDKAAASLHVRLSQLRKALAVAGEDERLVTRPPGYLIRAAAEDVDATRFEQLAEAGEAALAAGAAAAAVPRFDEALALWRGEALADVDDAPFARAEAARLAERRLAVLEARVEARLACGSHRELIGELESLTAAHPLRERFWSQRMIALYRAGRQADALHAYTGLRAILVGELGIEPGPELRELHARILRQDAGLTSTRRPPVPGGAPPPTSYVRTEDGVHIAYQVVGDGDLDIVAVPGLISHLDLWWEDPVSARFFRRLASLGRLIMFDKRDTGLSDRADGPSSLEQRMDDVQAVMRAAGSRRASLFGYSEGGPMSLLFAATYPERVTSLIMAAASARWAAAPGYPCGQQTGQLMSALQDLAAHRWGQGDSIEWYAPSIAASAPARRAFARWERMAVSPSAMLRMLDMIYAIDVRSALPAIGVPALVIQRGDDRITPVCHGRYLAAHLAGARYFEQPGDHVLWVGDTDAMFAEIQGFLAVAGSGPEPDRVLATVLSAEAAAAPGALLASYHAVAGHCAESWRGRLIRNDAGRVLATFDGPGRAIRCAAALRQAGVDLGLPVRAGIHAGEIDLGGGTATGLPVRQAAELAAAAQPGEILVSRTVIDLVAGSGICFADRGRHPVFDWPVSAVSGL